MILRNVASLKIVMSIISVEGDKEKENVLKS